jgi:hypothetical protein
LLLPFIFGIISRVEGHLVLEDEKLRGSDASENGGVFEMDQLSKLVNDRNRDRGVYD